MFPFNLYAYVKVKCCLVIFYNVLNSKMFPMNEMSEVFVKKKINYHIVIKFQFKIEAHPKINVFP